MSAWRRSPVARVTLVVMAVHTLWIAVYVVMGHEVRDFVHIGRDWVTRSTASPHIVLDPSYDYPRSRTRSATIGQHRGYDGQFAYFIALDFERAHHYMDAPAYRYQRILYPLTAWALAAGDRDLLPYSMVVVNWLAIALGTIAVALLLRRRGASPWWAAAYGLAPGLLLALQRDLTEPLAYGLAAAGLLALSGSHRHRFLLAALAFALAALARQTTLLIPFAWALATLLGWGAGGVRLRTRVARAALLASAIVPYLMWTAYLDDWLAAAQSPEPYVLVPFGWLFDNAWGLARQPPMVLFVVVPAVTWAACALWAGARGARRAEWACLVLTVLAVVVLAPAYNAYTSAGRAVLGALLLAVLCVPFLADLPERGRRLFLGASALYLVMAPVVFAYGLTDFEV